MFHRVDDFTTLPSVRFYSLASRLAHYDGAVRHVMTLALAELEREEPARLHAVPDVSPATLAALSDHPGFPSIEFTGG